MNKKSIPTWAAGSAVVAIVVVLIFMGYRAVNPPLPKPTVVNMGHGYAPTPPAGYTGGFAKAQ
jgi:hypothetical protein